MPLTSLSRENSIRRIQHELDQRRYDDAIAVAELSLWLEPDDLHLRQQILDAFAEELEPLISFDQLTATRVLDACSHAVPDDPRLPAYWSLLSEIPSKHEQELVERLWTEHHLRKKVAASRGLDFKGKKAILKALGLLE